MYVKKMTRNITVDNRKSLDGLVHAPEIIIFVKNFVTQSFANLANFKRCWNLLSV